VPLARISHLSRAEWSTELAAADAAPPGAFPEVADALAAGMGEPARAEAIVVASASGRTLVPHVRVEGRIGPSIEALPLGITPGPVPLEGAPAVPDAAALLRGLRAQRVELAVHHALAPADTASATSTHVVDLAAGLPRPRERARRRLRAAARAGVEVRVGTSDDAEGLLAVLDAAARERDRHRYPQAAVLAVARCPRAVVLLASLGGEDVSAALFLQSSYEVFYWLGGTLERAGEASPSYPVIEAALRRGADAGCRYGNLGSSDGLPGAAFFKEGFGARQVPSPVLSAVSRRHRAAVSLRRTLRR
jgi:hypothetical protein